MRSVTRTPVARLVALVRADPSGVRAGFVALGIASITGLGAGLALGAITGTLESLPGLLVLVPGAVAMRGAIFGALGSRFGTAIHTGVFRFTVARDSLVGQNVGASLILSLAISVVVAVFAKLIAVVFDIADSISLADFVVVSVVGGVLASVVVLAITIGVAELSVRRGWDLDNVAAPIVTSTGDLVALPALFLATALVEIDVVTPVLAATTVLVAVVALGLGWRSRRPTLREVVRQSLPVLVVAALISTVAGVAVERQAESFLAWPVFLVLLPPLLGMSGSLGGILAARLSTKLHLGLLDARRVRLATIIDDLALVALYAVTVFTSLGVLAQLGAQLVGFATPGLGDVVAAALISGVLVTVTLMVVGSLGAIFSYRAGLDPDNTAIPLVTAVLDVSGAIALILSLSVLGLT